MSTNSSFLKHDWPLPKGVSIAMTTRHGGCSCFPYDSLNLGEHVGDDKLAVAKNRQLLETKLNLPAPPVWLEQVHGVEVVDLPLREKNIPKADASYTNQANQVCVVMTADCLPVLLCNRQGTEVAAVHAGWRGLCDGVIEAAIAKFSAPRNEIMAFLGPAIGSKAFEVGAEVKQAFVEQFVSSAGYFALCGEGKYLADIQGLAQDRLTRMGVSECYCADTCTYTQADDYFSYRRDGQTGRMASLIWINS